MSPSTINTRHSKPGFGYNSLILIKVWGWGSPQNTVKLLNNHHPWAQSFWPLLEVIGLFWACSCRESLGFLVWRFDCREVMERHATPLNYFTSSIISCLTLTMKQICLHCTIFFLLRIKLSCPFSISSKGSHSTGLQKALTSSHNSHM